MKLILILAGMYTSKIVAYEAQKTRTHPLSLFGADFGPSHNCAIFLHK